MASTHSIVTKLIQQNSAVDPNDLKLLRYLVQRGAIDNAAYNNANTNTVATTTFTTFQSLLVDGGVGYNGGGAVVGGRTYKFRAYIPMLADATSGVKIDWQGGSCSFTSFQATGFNYVGSTLTKVQTAAVATPTTSQVGVTDLCIVEGTFVANAGGSFGPRIAVTTGTTATSILLGAYVQVTEIPLV